MARVGQLGLEFGDRAGAAHQLGLLGGDLLGRLALLRLGEILDLVAVLDGVLDQLLHGVEVGVAHRGQLDRRQVEVVLDPVLDAHRHQRIQAELDQRHLPRQVLGLVAHGAADDRGQPVVHGFAGVRRPLREPGGQTRPRSQVVLQYLCIVFRFGGYRSGRNLFGDSDSRGDGRRQRGGGSGAGHDGVVDQGEGLIDPRVHLNRGATWVAGQRGHQPGAVAGHRALLGGGQCGIRKHLGRSGFHQSGQVGLALRRVLPDMPAVRGGDMAARDHRRAVGGELCVEPVLLALEPGRRDVGVLARPEQTPDVEVVAVDVELRHRGDHRLDLVLLLGQRRDQLPVVQARGGGRQPDLHERHRIGRQLEERGVPVLDGVADALGEVDAVPQPLLPVVDAVDRLAARADVAALMDGGEVADVQRMGFDALQFGGQLAQQRVHLGGVAGALGLELAGELALGLGPFDDRIHLCGRTADHRLVRRGVDTHLQIGKVGEHRLDLVGGILHQRHQPDVLTEEHLLALAHQVRTRADGAGGVGQRQAAGEVGRRGLTERLADHRGGFGTVVAQQLTQRDLDREDHQLHDFDRVLAGLLGVVDRVVEDQFEDRVAALVLNEAVHLVDPLGEHLIAQVEVLAHLAVLGTETGQHPHRAVAHRSVGAEHQRALLAVGDRPQALDRLVVVVGHDDRAGAAVVAPRQRAADGLQRRRPARRAVDPVREFGGGGALARGQESRNGDRHNGNRLVGRLPVGARGLEQFQRLVGEAGQFRLGVTGSVLGGLVVVGGDELVLVVVLDQHPADIDRVGDRRGLLAAGLRVRLGLNEIRGQHLTQHQMRVGAAETEPRHARDRVPAVARPVGDGVGHLEPDSVEVDVGVWPGVVDGRRNLVAAQRQRHLGQAGRAGRRLQMPHIGFHRTEQCGLIGGAAAADHPAQRVGLDRVTQDRAGAVRLDVVHGARVDARVVVGLAQHLGLGVRVRREHAVGPAVVVDRAACDHGEDLVAVAPRVGNPLEHDHAAALRAGVPVGVGGERLDPPVGGQHATDLVEAQRDRGGHQGVDAAGHHHVGLTGAQRLHTGVHGHQRAGAGGVDGHRGAAEVVEVGHPVGDDRARGAGDRVGMRGARIHHRQIAVVVGGAADVHPDAAAAQAGCRDAGVLQRLPGQLERQPLLGIHVVGFHLRQCEELGVKTLEVLEISASGAGLGDPLGQPRLGHELRPATRGQIGDGVAALQQRLPHLVGGVHVPGEPGGQSDDRDVVDVSVPGPVLVVVGLELRLALDDHRRERLDGRMAERHRRGQRHAGEVLDIAGHRDRVARRQAQLHHRDGLVDGVRRLPGGVGHPVAQPLPHLGHRHVVAGSGQLLLGCERDLVGRFGRLGRR